MTAIFSFPSPTVLTAIPANAGINESKNEEKCFVKGGSHQLCQILRMPLVEQKLQT